MELQKAWKKFLTTFFRKFLAEDYGINRIFCKNVFLAENNGINRIFSKICENGVANL